MVGLGNVNRTLVRLLEDRRQELRERHGISWRITGIASRRLGWIADAGGLETAAILTLNSDLTSGLSRTEPGLSLSTGVSAPHEPPPPTNVRGCPAAPHTPAPSEAIPR